MNSGSITPLFKNAAQGKYLELLLEDRAAVRAADGPVSAF